MCPAASTLGTKGVHTREALLSRKREPFVPLNAPVLFLLVYFVGNAASMYFILSPSKEEDGGDKVRLNQICDLQSWSPGATDLRPCRGAWVCLCASAPSWLLPVSPRVFSVLKSLSLLLHCECACPYFCRYVGLHPSFLVEVLYCGLAKQVMK